MPQAVHACLDLTADRDTRSRRAVDRDLALKDGSAMAESFRVVTIRWTLTGLPSSGSRHGSVTLFAG